MGLSGQLLARGLSYARENWTASTRGNNKLNFRASYLRRRDLLQIGALWSTMLFEIAIPSTQNRFRLTTAQVQNKLDPLIGVKSVTYRER